MHVCICGLLLQERGGKKRKIYESKKFFTGLIIYAFVRVPQLFVDLGKWKEIFFST